jgi:hypothetical protein
VGLFGISTCFTITKTNFTYQEFPVFVRVGSNSVSIIFARELALELWEGPPSSEEVCSLCKLARDLQQTSNLISLKIACNFSENI